MQQKLSGKEKGESAFCIIYLLFLLIAAVIFLSKEKYVIFVMIFLLGFGDSFHLIPRIKKNLKGDFPKSDFYLGLGNQISSITMTLFYLILFFLVSSTILISFDDVLMDVTPSLGYTIKSLCETIASYIIEPTYEIFPSTVVYLSLIRIVLCLLPGNKWYKKEGSQAMAIIRNIPFVLIGCIVVFYNTVTIGFDLLSILIILSFLFYLPVALFGKKNPKLGMLMIPKTICYILMILYLL